MGCHGNEGPEVASFVYSRQGAGFFCSFRFCLEVKEYIERPS